MRLRIAIAGTVIGTAAGITLSRVAQWRRTWGIDPREATKPLAGDDLVPVTSAVETRGITIDAPPEAVWPWLVQMGYGRAGWYSYDQLDMKGKSAVDARSGVGDDRRRRHRRDDAGQRLLGPRGRTRTGAGPVHRHGPGRDAGRGRPRDRRGGRDVRRGADVRAVRTGGLGRVPGHRAARLRSELGIRPRTARRRPDAAHRALPCPVRRWRGAASGSSHRSWALACS